MKYNFKINQFEELYINAEKLAIAGSDGVIVKIFPFNTNHKVDKNKLVNDYITSQQQ